MHQELIDRLLVFAKEYDLIFSYWLDEVTHMYHFKFVNKEHTWGFCSNILQERLDLFNGPTEFFADQIIDDVRRAITEVGA